jgi:hypothetical protein
VQGAFDPYNKRHRSWFPASCAPAAQSKGGISAPLKLQVVGHTLPAVMCQYLPQQPELLKHQAALAFKDLERFHLGSPRFMPAEAEGLRGGKGHRALLTWRCRSPSSSLLPGTSPSQITASTPPRQLSWSVLHHPSRPAAPVP